MTTRPKPIEQADDFQIGSHVNTGTHAEYQDMMRRDSYMDPRLAHSTHFKKNHNQAKKLILSANQAEQQVRPKTEHQDVKFGRKISKTRKNLQKRVEQIRVQRDLD